MPGVAHSGAACDSGCGVRATTAPRATAVPICGGGQVRVITSNKTRKTSLECRDTAPRTFEWKNPRDRRCLAHVEICHHKLTGDREHRIAIIFPGSLRQEK